MATVSQMPSIHIIAVLRQIGDLIVQVLNASEEANILSQMAALGGVLLFLGSKVEWDKSVVDELSLEVHGITLETREGNFPYLGCLINRRRMGKFLFEGNSKCVIKN